jgi:hypothetical protein
VAAAAALAAFSPGARSALLDWLDAIPGVRIERAPALPRSELLPALDFGRPSSLAQARRRADFTLRLPKRLGRPDRVFFDRDGAGGAVVTLVYGTRLVLTEWRTKEVLFYKLLGRGSSTELTDVAGSEAVWLSGGDHAVFYLGGDGAEQYRSGRLAGNVLVWREGGVGYRLEAAVSLREAIDLAESLEP